MLGLLLIDPRERPDGPGEEPAAEGGGPGWRVLVCFAGALALFTAAGWIGTGIAPVPLVAGAAALLYVGVRSLREYLSS